MPLLWDTDGDGKFDDWCNPKSFQIISAGLDDNYGSSGTDIDDTGAGNPITANNAAITQINGQTVSRRARATTPAGPTTTI